MDSKMERALERAGVALGLRNPIVYPPGQTTTAWVLRWRNDDGKYEQVWVYPETFISRHETVTTESMTAEVRRLIEAGETEVLN